MKVAKRTTNGQFSVGATSIFTGPTFKPREENVPPPVLDERPFHDHLDACEQCREHPFDLCPVGALLLAGAMGRAP